MTRLVNRIGFLSMSLVLGSALSAVAGNGFFALIGNKGTGVVTHTLPSSS